MTTGPAGKVPGVGARFLRTEIEPFLRSKKFTRRREAFGKWVAMNCGVVQFLPGRLTERERCDFEVDIGVFNRRIFEFDTVLNPTAKVPVLPEVVDCHWRKPLYWAMPGLLPDFLPIRSKIPFQDQGLQVRSAFESRVLPLLDQAMTDEGFKDFLMREWRERGMWGSGGLSGFELISLAVLLAELGPMDQLVMVVDALHKELAEMPHATLAMRRLARIHELRPGLMD